MPPISVDWLSLTGQFLSLSLLSIGGAITVAPDMHRYLVTEHGWLSDAQFNSSIALSQAAPGPNVLFVALLGFQVGLNANAGLVPAYVSWAQALAGSLLTLFAILLPSSLLNHTITRWAHRNQHRRAVRAFKQGMAPIVVALILSTGWLLASAHDQPATDWPLWLLTAASAVLAWRTRLHLLWLIGAGALLGAMGWV